MEGTWQIDANGWLGTTSITRHRGAFRGTVTFDRVGQPANLTRISIDRGSVGCERGDQAYTGIVKGDVALGTFATTDGVRCSWEPRRRPQGRGQAVPQDRAHALAMRWRAVLACA